MLEITRVDKEALVVEVTLNNKVLAVGKWVIDRTEEESHLIIILT
jgi:hypothetical protein